MGSNLEPILVRNILDLPVPIAGNRFKKGLKERFAVNMSSAVCVVFGAPVMGTVFFLTGAAGTFEARAVGVSAGDIFKVHRWGRSELPRVLA